MNRNFDRRHCRWLITLIVLSVSTSIASSQSPAGEPPPPRCAVLEVFLRGDGERSRDAAEVIRQRFGDRPGVRLVIRNVEGERQHADRYWQLVEHFKLTEPGLPAFYLSGQFETGWDRNVTPARLEEHLTVELFTRPGCRRCQQLKPVFFSALQSKYPGYRWVERDVVADSQHATRLQTLARRYRVQATSLPAVHVPGRLFVGLVTPEASVQQWDERLERFTLSCVQPPDTASPEDRSGDDAGPTAQPQENPEPDAAASRYRSGLPLPLTDRLPVRFSGLSPEPWLGTLSKMQLSGVLRTMWPPLLVHDVIRRLSTTEIVGRLGRRAWPGPTGPGFVSLAQSQPSGDFARELPPELTPPPRRELPPESDAGGAYSSLSTSDEEPSATQADTVTLPWIGEVRWRDWGMPAFTVMVGLIDGFNPCAMWVLLFLLSVLVNLKDRWKILAVAGTFVLVSGIAYFLFMAAWMNVFYLVGLLRPVQIALGLLGIVVGSIHIKDFFAFGKGISLSIPEKAKPGLYGRVRKIVQAESLGAAIVGATVLAVLVNVVELLCTAGLPAMYTGILTAQGYPVWLNYLYLLLYILAYMFDDSLMVAIVVVTLGRHKLQERGGRILKLISGLVIFILGAIMLLVPEWLI
jgi:hypothetical protein